MKTEAGHWMSEAVLLFCEIKKATLIIGTFTVRKCLTFKSGYRVSTNSFWMQTSLVTRLVTRVVMPLAVIWVVVIVTKDS